MIPALAFSLAVGAGESRAADVNWEKKQAPIMTVWGEAIDVNTIPLNEYPRPQMVREHWQNLNGVWDYYKSSIVNMSYQSNKSRFKSRIMVPYAPESALSGVRDLDFPGNSKCSFYYQRKFTLGSEFSNKRVLLNFGAVDWRCTVYVNGKQAGTHKGGSTPFSLDITDLVNSEGENELQVVALDPSNNGGQPCGKQSVNPGGCFYTPVSGIWQTVWLEPVAEAHISRYDVVPDIDSSKATITVESASAGAVADFVVKADGAEVASLKGCKVNEPVALKLSDLRLWTPDSPFLYDLEITLRDKSGEATDKVDGYFGMRKISTAMVDGHPAIMLNNKATFNFGTLDQGWWPDGLLTPPSDEALRFDIEETKKFGFNMIRKHVKVEPDRWYYWADKLGVLVWQDIPSGGDKGTLGDKAAIQQNFYEECGDIVKTMRNHPSIVMWVVFNEGWGQDASDNNDTHTRLGYEAVKAADDSRLINAVSGWTDFEIGDIIDRHSYALGPLLHDNPVNKRAAVCGEYGGISLMVENHLWAGNGFAYVTVENNDALTDKFNNHILTIRGLQKDGIWGAVYTQISDVEQEVNGLLTYDRKVVKNTEEQRALMREMIETTIEYRKVDDKVIMDAGDTSAEAEWSYTMAAPAEGWTAIGFDDSAWEKACGGFGRSVKNVDGILRTNWNTSDIYMRRAFDASELTDTELGSMNLWIYHDDDVEVFINGVKAFAATGYTQNYKPAPISAEALATITRDGNNIIAVHCHQDGWGQYVDCGLRCGSYRHVSEFPVEGSSEAETVAVAEACDSLVYLSALGALSYRAADGGEGAVCKVFNINGSCVLSTRVSNSLISLETLDRGFYIARVGNAICKFVK